MAFFRNFGVNLLKLLVRLYLQYASAQLSADFLELTRKSGTFTWIAKLTFSALNRNRGWALISPPKTLDFF